MPNNRKRAEWEHPCPRCKAAAEAPCRNRKGEVVYNMHAARRMLARGEEVVPGRRWRGQQTGTPDVCQAVLVPCWMSCAVRSPDCEFCGVCNDADCERLHFAS